MGNVNASRTGSPNPSSSIGDRFRRGENVSALKRKEKESMAEVQAFGSVEESESFTTALALPSASESHTSVSLRSPEYSVEEICSFFASTYDEMLRCEHPRDQFESEGRAVMMNQVAHWVRKGRAIRCLLPAFPVKSPSPLKVGGRLGDLGESVALARLDEFAHVIGQKYEPGCRVLIVSDGRVYADLAGRSVEDVRDFNMSIRAMANPRYIRFTELNLLDESGMNEYTALDEEDEALDLELLRKISSIGSVAEDRTIDILMEEYGVTDEEVDKAIKESPNLTAVYRGFIKFMMVDGLPWQDSALTSKKQVEKMCKQTARKMIARNMAYARRVEEQYPDHVRFSIHGHDNSKKFSVRFYAGIQTCATPWHNVTCEMLDGRFVPLKKVVVDLVNGSIPRMTERETPLTHTLDKKCYACFEKEADSFDGWTPGISARTFEEIRTDDGDFWCYREVEAEVADDGKSEEENDELAHWAHLDVTFARVSSHPSSLFGGLLIESQTSSASMLDVPVESLRRLVHRHGTVVLRGFERIDDERALEDCARHLGEPVEWEYGLVFDITQSGLSEAELIAKTRRELPLHWDGMFKVGKDGSFPDVPTFQFFHCLEEYPDKSDVTNGRTMIVDTRPVIQEGLGEADLERLSRMKVEYDMAPNGTYGGVLEQNVVCEHPVTGEKILRFLHERDDEHAHIGIRLVGDEGENGPDQEPGKEQLEWVQNLLVPILMKDERFVYSHCWERNDFMVTDNISQLHWRTTVEKSGRILKRIHFN